MFYNYKAIYLLCSNKLNGSNRVHKTLTIFFNVKLCDGLKYIIAVENTAAYSLLAVC